jgi:hypothetical protein
MRISMERSGGFTGIKLKGPLDSATLPLSQARLLKQLLRKSGFFEPPPVLESNAAGADCFSYKATVETADGKHNLESGEAAIPCSMRPFLDFLTRSVHFQAK